MAANVLLVILDSVRARNCSLGGAGNGTTPFCETFADRATTYTQARSPGAKSLTSHMSIFTGLHVEQHNITSAGDSLAGGYSVFERLRDDGYATGVFSENTWVTDVEVGLKDGFDTVEGPRNVPFPDAVDPKSFVAEEGQGQYREYLKASLGGDQPVRSLTNGLVTKLTWDFPWLLPESLRTSTPADVYADLFLDWEREQDGPWAACINFMDAHIPYEPDPEFDHWGGPDAREIQDDLEDLKWVFLGGQEPWWKRRALEGLYDGAIAQMDAQLRRIVETLAERGSLDETLVVVTSDHGEGFGERSEIRDVRVAEHGVAIHEGVTHVPLLVKYPGQTEGATVTEPATLTRFPDVVAESREGTAGPESFVPEGPVLVSAVGLNDALLDRAGQYIDDLRPYTATARAVLTVEDGTVVKDVTWRDRARRVVVRDAQTSYAVDADPDAVRSRVEEAFADVSDAGVRAKGKGIEGASDATRQRLEDLGYV
ncbi:sulfatase-like hydrolase/transferase [Halostella salina]|uniref:sulfatase-like hydrolase/transferase n=1 Tax=Halostella salina TaxID=1547897 RepID=UPI000EF81345|nr:sulfatase-like hydrolase/transferase [Halostella salina]